MSEITPQPKKRKVNVSPTKYGTKCICSDPDCDASMEKLKLYNPSRYAYFTIPKEPGDLKDKPKPEQIRNRARKFTKRRRLLAALPSAATSRANDKAFSNKSIKQFASLHLHDKVYQLCTRDSRGHRKLVDSISPELARDLSKNHDLTFTTSDMFEDGTYVPLPNVTKQKFVTYANDLERKSLSARVDVQTTPQMKTRASATAATADQIHAEQIEDQMASQAAQIEQQKSNLIRFETELKKRQEELEMREKALTKSHIDLKERMKILQCGDAVYGLTRSSLLSKYWHKKHPDAVRNLFGFQTWKELVCTFYALFDVVPHKNFDPTTDDISPFEKYLMGYMRMHTAMTVFAISLIFDRDRSHTGRCISSAVKEIGAAGKDLSILDITPEFLEATCPQQYKDEGLEHCCAVPDGKDFKIYTSRKNTLFTRASYSDKVHTSAVRCISWSTPYGLSFEHTDLFLARVSEKKLVELWGPRLKKCPRGWYMLSDRGFFDTARYYPNMNHQKTPKFLSGRDQFTADEVSADRRICKLRYTCEVAFARVTKTRGLRDVIPSDYFQTLDAMNHWGHATVNLDAPLMSINT